MIVGSIKENTTLEKRISITPESAKNIIGLGLKVCIEKGYAIHLGIDDKDYKGRLTFELVIDPEENKLIKEAARDARLKELEDENNANQKDIEDAEAKGAGGGLRGINLSIESQEDYQRRKKDFEFQNTKRRTAKAKNEENKKFNI